MVGFRLRKRLVFPGLRNLSCVKTIHKSLIACASVGFCNLNLEFHSVGRVCKLGFGRSDVCGFVSFLSLCATDKPSNSCSLFFSHTRTCTRMISQPGHVFVCHIKLSSRRTKDLFFTSGHLSNAAFTEIAVFLPPPHPAKRNP